METETYRGKCVERCPVYLGKMKSCDHKHRTTGSHLTEHYPVKINPGVDQCRINLSQTAIIKQVEDHRLKQTEMLDNHAQERARESKLAS